MEEIDEPGAEIAMAAQRSLASPSQLAAQPSFFATVADTVSQIVDALVDVDRTIAALMGVKSELLDQARLWGRLNDQTTSPSSPASMRDRALRAEVACALKVPERTVESQLAVSETLVHDLRPTLTALRAGEISYRHAQLMVDGVSMLEKDARSVLEREALPFARKLTAAKFERKLRTLRERAHPESIVERHRKAVGDREVQYCADRDGMAWLSAYLPSADALGAYNRLTDLARSLQAADEMRTVTQLRADVFRDLLLDGEPALEGPRGIRPRVFVTVPVLTLLGQSDEPGNLDGYGPIDAETACHLAAGASSFIRLLTHPETGAVLSVGKESYRVPSDLKNWLRIRDTTCRFPGCSRDAAHCDIDHTDDWGIDGETEHDNLAHLCRSHHRLKHATDWRVAHVRDGTASPGTLTWTSPVGRKYTTEPEVRMRV